MSGLLVSKLRTNGFYDIDLICRQYTEISQKEKVEEEDEI